MEPQDPFGVRVIVNGSGKQDHIRICLFAAPSEEITVYPVWYNVALQIGRSALQDIGISLRGGKARSEFIAVCYFLFIKLFVLTVSQKFSQRFIFSFIGTCLLYTSPSPRDS